ncbi:restriction endonuclease subunit S [Bacillus sp. REN16]|uniref:restriction endonuclease subunit S n=1 Tax=Bacillus sp. REN16 TaxID=2887296 RepID=UPI001E356BCD|nr:restriction endonuclease subunit S [Bacillus sp. REN16]MCC3359677.1 restriction endonuclease subunit S [Bacillus sp. REN16]
MIEKIVNQEIPKGYKKGKHYVIPENWDDLVISDIVRFSGGAQPPRSEFINEPRKGYIRLIQIRDYKTDDYLTYIPIEKARKFCDETDVMIGRYGPPIFQILRGLEGAYNVALMKAIPDEKRLLKEYLFYYLQNGDLYNLIDRLSRRTSGQTGVDIEALNNFPFPLPSITEQKKILSVINTWEKAIELKEKLIEWKKERHKGLLQKLLWGHIRWNDLGKGLSKGDIEQRTKFISTGVPPKGYQKIKSFIIPDDWEFVEISKIAKQVTRLNKDNKNYVVLSCTKYKGLVDSLKYFGKQVFSSDLSKYKVVSKSEFAYATNHIEEGSIGLQKDYDYGLVSPMYTVFKTNNYINNEFLFALLKTENYRRIFETMMSASVDRRGSLRWNEFSKIKIPLPPNEEQEVIISILLESNKEIEYLEKEIENLKLQRKGLLQLLLTGKLRVNV